MEQIGPSGLPRFGHSPRVRHGVWMAPMKYKPASVRDGSTTATSSVRRPSSTMEGWSFIA
jgi:hypothetical protein